MKIETRDVEGIKILKLDGRLDPAGASELDKQIKEVIKADSKALVLDLSAVSYASSAAFRVFVSAAKILKQSSKKLILLGVPFVVKEALDISGMTPHFSLCKTEKEAIEALK